MTLALANSGRGDLVTRNRNWPVRILKLQRPSNMSTPIFSRLSRVWATSRCLTIPTSTSRVALTSRSPSSFFTPHLLHKKSPLPAVPLNARGFSQSYLLQFARSRFSSSRQNWYPPPPRGGGTGSSGFLNGLRRRVDRINPDTIFYGIIGINVAVFGGW